MCGEALSFWPVRRRFIHGSVSSGECFPCFFLVVPPPAWDSVTIRMHWSVLRWIFGMGGPSEDNPWFSVSAALPSQYAALWILPTRVSLSSLLCLPTSQAAGLFLSSLSHSCSPQLCAVSELGHSEALPPSFSSPGDHCSLLPLVQCLKTAISGMLPSSFFSCLS